MAAGIWLGMGPILEWRKEKVALRSFPGSTRCHLWCGIVLTDCYRPVNCVTSLNMRKWMKDRLQRRKKKTPEPGSEPAPPPLQPAYFDAEQAPSPALEPSHIDSPQIESSRHEAEVPVPSEPEFEALPAREESPAADGPSRPQSGADGQRGRGRRRRGGRGRGGRGREQAVAQAFTPAAAKGIIPEVGVHEVGADAVEEDGAEEAAAEESTPEGSSLKRNLRRKRPALQQRCRQRRPVPRKASWFSPSDYPVPARVPGSSATTWSRFPATWCVRFCSMTSASSAFRTSCFPTCVPC